MEQTLITQLKILKLSNVKPTNKEASFNALNNKQDDSHFFTCGLWNLVRHTKYPEACLPCPNSENLWEVRLIMSVFVKTRPFGAFKIH